jgi:hypothetical protein
MLADKLQDILKKEDAKLTVVKRLDLATKAKNEIVDR